MSLKLYDDQAISNIASAIRAKGVSGSFTVGQMANAVLSIPSGSQTYYVVGYSSGTVLHTDSSINSASLWALDAGYAIRWIEGTVVAVYTP